MPETGAELHPSPRAWTDRPLRNSSVGMQTDRIAQAVAALRAAGHHVEEVPAVDTVFRVDNGGAVTGPALLALAIGLGVMDAPEPPEEA